MKFDFGKHALTEIHRADINRIAELIFQSWKSDRPVIGVLVVGHTDEIGEAKFNEDLGRLRAQAVLQWLNASVAVRDQGLVDRMSWGATSEGERRPVSRKHADNRRAEIHITFGRVTRPAAPPAPSPQQQCLRRCLAQEQQCLRRWGRPGPSPACMEELRACGLACRRTL